LSDQAQALLLQHKDLGLYLAIAMFIATLLKVYGCTKQNLKVEIISVCLLAIISAGILYQGKMGGDLTYMHGAHVEAYSDGMDCIEEQKEFAETEE
jgi:uncharacterized membrane protein